MEKESNEELKKILYEMVIILKIKKEPELLRCPSSRNFEYYFPSIKKLKEHEPWDAVNKTFSWKLALADQGKLIAIVQENSLEIRSSRDQYISLFCKINIEKDASPELRKIAWSPDCNMIAICSSVGNISVYNIRGIHLFNIDCSEQDQSEPISLFFMDSRIKSAQWPYELVVLYKTGLLISFKVASDLFQEYHSFQFPSACPVTDISFLPSHKVCIVSYGINCASNLNTNNSGLTIWRLLNDHPYYKLSIPEKMVGSKSNYLKSLLNIFHKENENYIYKIKVSADFTRLACLHLCGSISIWSLPTLLLIKKHDPLEDPPYDLNWWNDDHIAICSLNKKLTICQNETLVNYLGDRGEQLEGVTVMPSTKQNNCLMALEHNTEFIRRAGEEDDKLVDTVIDSAGILLKFYETFKAISFMVFDVGGTPKKKKSKIVSCTYRVLSIQSITPEELFSRKIEKEEYEEALSLAKTYSMDADRVYQRQWRYTPVSSFSIQNYLNKITKRLWVLHECCERVPESLQAANELLQFGLQATSISAVINQDTALSMEAEDHEKDENNEVYSEQLSQLMLLELSEEQMELIQMRKQLLHLSDKLFTYQMIIGGPGVAETTYEKDKYDRFRLQSVIKSAVEYARDGNSCAVEYILTLHGEEVLPYWLHILNNFPENCDPTIYKDLLPECSNDGTPYIWEQKMLRKKDWCEQKWGVYNNDHYTKCTPLTALTIDIIMEWYTSRVISIVDISGLVENAIIFLKIALEKKIKGLDELYCDLLTMESIIYSYDDELSYMTLSRLQNIEPVKQMILLTNKKEYAFLNDLKKNIIPYLNRKNRTIKKQLINVYFKHLSQDNIMYVYQLVKNFEWGMLFDDENELGDIVIESIYACRNNDSEQDGRINEILTILNSYNINQSIVDKIGELKVVLRGCHILQKYNIDKTWDYIKLNKTKKAIANDIVDEIIETIEEKITPFSEQFVLNLLDDLIVLQSELFSSCVTKQDIYRKYVHGLLLSRNIFAIQYCENVISTTSSETNKLLNFTDSVDFVIEAAQRYFNMSQNVKDDTLTLSRICLKLIKEKHDSIVNEINLILALHVLNEFNVHLLPITIRMCESKDKIIDRCLLKRKSYRKINQLIELCDYLNIFDKEYREITILCKTINIALEQYNDIKFCTDKCLYIINKNIIVGNGWQACYSVARRNDLNNIAMKTKFLTFALLHCDSDHLLDIISLKTELRYNDVNSTVDNLDMFQPASSEPEQESNLFSVGQFLNLTRSTSFWKNVFQLQKDELEDKIIETFDCFSVDEFYGDLHESCSCVTTDCSKLFTKHFINLNLALRINIDNDCSYDKALVTCARMSFGLDTILALRYLLILKDIALSEECFSNVPLTEATCRTALLCFSLYYLKQYDPKVVYLPPSQVIKAMKVISQNEQDNKYSECIKLFNSYVQFEEQFSCIDQLKKYDYGVNVRRFITDSEYRADSILGLAMDESESAFSLSMFLGEKYNMDLYAIIKQHIVSILLSSSAPQKLIQSTLKDSYTHVLTQDALSRLTEEIFCRLGGCDHYRLITLFKFVQGFECSSGISISNMSVKDHIKLLIKVTSTSLEIDYKLLLECKILESFDKILNDSTILIIIKLIKSLPPHMKSSVTLSSVYYKLLHNSLSNYQNPEVSFTNGMLEYFKKSTSYLNKMEGADMLNFLQQLIFSDKFSNTNINTRGRVVTLAIQYLQQNVDLNERSMLKEKLIFWQEHIRRVKQLSAVMPTDDPKQYQLIEDILMIPLSGIELESLVTKAIENNVISDGRTILTMMNS